MWDWVKKATESVTTFVGNSWNTVTNVAKPLVGNVIDSLAKSENPIVSGTVAIVKGAIGDTSKTIANTVKKVSSYWQKYDAITKELEDTIR